MDMLTGIAENIWNVYLDTAVWLLLGLFAAGIIKTYLSNRLAKSWLGGDGLLPVIKATLLGAPLPLCSCGVLPAATGLRRAGASKGVTVSFLISTPETGVDSIAVSYALLGPVMAIARVIAALSTAILTGFAVARLVKDDEYIAASEQACKPCDVEQTIISSKPTSLRAGLTYAFGNLLDDLIGWLMVGILLAGLLLYFVPPERLSEWGTGVAAMFIMLVVGVPMYICAVASVPVAVALLVAGVAPGAVLVFLLAGPATNVAGLAVVKQELGLRVLTIYLLGIVVCSLSFGYALDWFFNVQAYDIRLQMSHAHIVPAWLKGISAILLLLMAVKPLRNTLLKVFFR